MRSAFVALAAAGSNRASSRAYHTRMMRRDRASNQPADSRDARPLAVRLARAWPRWPVCRRQLLASRCVRAHVHVLRVSGRRRMSIDSRVAVIEAAAVVGFAALSLDSLVVRCQRRIGVAGPWCCVQLQTWSAQLSTFGTVW